MAHFQKQARQFLKVGMNLLQQSTGVRLNDSSDDDEEEVAEDQLYIQNGQRGTIVFKTLSAKSQRQKILHINLFKQQIITYSTEHTKKVYSCEDIATVTRFADSNVGIEVKRPMALQTRSKRITFESESMAHKFHLYVEFINESGKHIKSAFSQIDFRKTGTISAANLMKSLERVDLIASSDEVNAMLSMGDSGAESFDYCDFFHLFINSFVSNLRECLQEWLTQATVAMKPRPLSRSHSSNSNKNNSSSNSSSSAITATSAGAGTGTGAAASSKKACRSTDRTFSLHAVPGEVVAFAPRERIHWGVYSGAKHCKQPHLVPGLMYATNYRVVLFSLRKTPAGQRQRHSRYDIPAFFNKISIPLATCQRIYHAAPRNSIYLVGKDFRTVRISLSSYENSKNKAETFVQVLQGIAYHNFRYAIAGAMSSSSGNSSSGKSSSSSGGGMGPQSPTGQQHMSINRSDSNINSSNKSSNSSSSGASESITAKAAATSNSNNSGTTTAIGSRISELKAHLFAFKYRSGTEDSSGSQLGWNRVHLIKEYVRQGLYDAPEWQIFENIDWGIMETYPRYLALPKNMSNSEIVQAAQFRSKMRLPAITYLHKSSGAVLTRSAQPLVGIAQNNCIDDERLLNLYRCKGRIHPPKSEGDVFSKLYIFDARGKVAATLNMAAGKGTEDVSLYQNTELVFCNIDNIHVMRSSAAALAEAIAMESSMTTSAMLTEAQLLSESSASNFLARVQESGWMRHLRLILLASVVAAEKLHFEGASVLIHCSDGWDRTAQTCSMVQLILDPYFRTLEGLAALIEKDWCAFGFQFQYRCGHGLEPSQLPDERSPVFLQFIETLQQLLVQFPNAFEYNDSLLLFLVDHLHSCLFGNFLGNCERDRMLLLEVRENTRSIWEYVLDKQCNAHFVNASYRAFDFPLWPATSLAKLRLWERFWLRWEHASHPNSFAGEEWHDDWGVGIDTDESAMQRLESFGDGSDSDDCDSDDGDLRGRRRQSANAVRSPVADHNNSNHSRSNGSKGGGEFTASTITATASSTAAATATEDAVTATEDLATGASDATGLASASASSSIYYTAALAACGSDSFPSTPRNGTATDNSESESRLSPQV